MAPPHYHQTTTTGLKTCLKPSPPMLAPIELETHLLLSSKYLYLIYFSNRNNLINIQIIIIKII